MAGVVRNYKVMFNTTEQWPEVIFTTPAYVPIEGDEDVTDMFYDKSWAMLSMLYPRYSMYLNDDVLSLVSNHNSKRKGDVNYLCHRSVSRHTGLIFEEGDYDYRIYTM